MTDLSYRKKSLTETFSSSSTDSNHEEEERLKLLFLSCDSNNDGRLDKRDLVKMCQKLNMHDVAEEIVSALGANVNGSTISFPEFMKCRAKVLQFATGIDNLKKSAEYLVHSPYYSHPSQGQYDHVRGSCSDVSQVYSSVDYDSGTQDIHEEPLSLYAMLHQCYPDLYCRWTTVERESPQPSIFQQLLQCANQIHLARLNRIYTELKIAVKRINSNHANRDVCQKEITRLQKEKDKLKLEIQNQASRYEDRLTELHSVIAELRKKIDKKDKNTIFEEDEDVLNDEEDDGNNAEDYEKLNLTKVSNSNLDDTINFQKCSVDSIIAESNMCSMDRSMLVDRKDANSGNIDIQTDNELKSNYQVFNLQKDDKIGEKVQEVTEKQLKSLHHSHIYLQEKLSGYETVVCNLRNQLANVLDEREALRKQVRDLQDYIEQSNIQTQMYPSHLASCSVSKISLDSKSTNSSSSSPARPIMGVRQQCKQNQIKSQTSEPEWVIKAVSKYHKGFNRSNPNPSLPVHHLNDEVQSINSGLCFLQELADSIPHPSLIEPLKRITLEWQRLIAFSERDSADKLLLQTTLAESKCISDQLQCSIAQLQSDCAALARSNILADQIIELADILLQLQETDPLSGMLDVSHQSISLEPAYQNSSVLLTSDSREANPAADIDRLRHGYREQVESAAKLFLYRIECHSSVGRQTPDSGAGVSSTLSSGGGSVDVEGVLRQTSCSGGDWSKTDELKLKRLLEQLISERSRAGMSIVGTHLGQSYYGGHCNSSSNQSSLHRQQNSKSTTLEYDFNALSCNQHIVENAILLQEVCSLKEERATLKTHIYLLEKEVKSIQLTLDSKAAAEKSLKIQLNQLMQQQRSDPNGTGNEEIRKLKIQIEDLLQALEELRERCQLQQQQNEEFVNDLKKANAALIGAFEKAKRKYQMKIARLESQISNAPRPSITSMSDETAL